MNTMDRSVNNIDNLFSTKNSISTNNKRVFLTDPPVDPNIFFTRINQLKEQTQLFFSVMSAHKMGFFDYLSNSHTISDLEGLYPHSEMIQPLLKVLVNNNYIEESEGRYQNTSLVSTYFCSSSVYYQGAYLDKIYSRINELWTKLPEMVNEGPVTYSKKDFFSNFCLPPMAENAMTGRLQQVIRIIVSLPEFLNANTMLDLGGGHGLYAIALASLKKDLNCTVFDLPDVIDITCDYIIDNNMDEQVKVIPGDFFVDDFGSGYDIILSSSNPSGKNIKLIGKIFEALKPGGLFINIQPDDRDERYDPLSILERKMWNLEGDSEFRSNPDGKNRPFLSLPYTDSVKTAGFDILQVETVTDRCFEDYSVTMVVCKKPAPSPKNRLIRVSINSGDVEKYSVVLDINQSEEEWIKDLTEIHNQIRGE